MPKKCAACVKAELRGGTYCTKHANMAAARQKRWREKNPARNAYGPDAEAMSYVAEMIAERILLAEDQLDPHARDYVQKRNWSYPWWWSLEPRYAVPPYTKVEVPDMPPHPRILKQMVWEAYLRIKEERKRAK